MLATLLLCSYLLLSLLLTQVYDKGMVAAAASIIQKEGPGALLSGLGPTVVGYGVEGAMKFGLYEVGKPVFGALLNSRKAVGEAADIPPLAFILASVLAGAIAAVLLCPMESLRIKQVTDEEYANTSLMTGLPKLMQTDGMTALFGGLLAMLVKQVRSRWLLIYPTFSPPYYGCAVQRASTPHPTKTHVVHVACVGLRPWSATPPLFLCHYPPFFTVRFLTPLVNKFHLT